jgi:APA family basic amino acid/polyamine antiporter
VDHRLGSDPGVCRLEHDGERGFAAHVVDLLDWFGLHPSAKWISPAYLPMALQDLQGQRILYAPGWHFGFNIPAFLIVLLLTVVLVRGIRESAGRTTSWWGEDHGDSDLCLRGAGFIHPGNWHPLHRRMAGRAC